VGATRQLGRRIGSAVGPAGLLALGAVAVLGACGTSAGSPYAGLTELRFPGGEAVVRYLSPPWRLLTSSPTSVQLLIDREGATTDLDSGLIVLPKYLLTITIAPTGTASVIAAADAAGATARGEVVLVPPRAITTDSGDMGLEVLTSKSLPFPRYQRYVTLDSSRGGVVRLVFEGNPTLDEPEVTAMIRQVDVAPEAP